MNEPRTLTDAVNRCRLALSTMGWADQVLGRAQIQNQQDTGQDRPYLLPMIPRDGITDEYVSGLPNDEYKSVLFFVATGPELSDYSQDLNPRNYAPNHIIRARRPVALIGWANLAELGGAYRDESGWGELLKLDIKNKLKQVACVSEISTYTDSPLAEVYKPFQVEQLDAKYDRLPYVIFRLDFVLHTVETNRPRPAVAFEEPQPEPQPPIIAD